MLKNKPSLPINIQLFAEQPTAEELAKLAEDLGGNQTPPTGTPPTNAELNPDGTPKVVTQDGTQSKTPEELIDEALDKEAKEKGISIEELKKQKEDEQEDPEDKAVKDKKGGIKELREQNKANAKKAKELEDAKIKLEQDTKDKTTKLMKAIKLGIKGETEEEVLANLETHENQEEAKTKGLTEEQIRKEKELNEKMSKLTEEQRMFVFNQRAFNLQKEKDLSPQQLNSFILKAGSLGIDLVTNVASFSKIYDEIMITPTGTPTAELTAAQLEIKELKAEIERLKNPTGAPGKTPPGTTQSGQGWEATLRNMDGKK